MKLKGNQNEYTEIGTRGTERLAFSMVYANHPMTGVGHLLARFVAYRLPGSASPLKMLHFSPRAYGKLTTEEGKEIDILRLNRLAFPIFSKNVIPATVLQVGDTMGVWEMVGSWIREQLKHEGFTYTIEDMTEFVRSHFKAPDTGDVQLLLEFPDLKAIKDEASAHSNKQFGQPAEEEGFDV